MRPTALLIAALLVLPAALVLLRPRRAGARPATDAPRSLLDLVWTAVPVVLLVVLVALSVAA